MLPDAETGDTTSHLQYKVKIPSLVAQHVIPFVKSLLYTEEKFDEEFKDLDWINSSDLSVGFGFGFESFSERN
jgi:hypothetical protein